MTEISAHPQVNKTAIVSTDRLIRVITNIIAKVSGKTDKIRCFRKKDNALSWLQDLNK